MGAEMCIRDSSYIVLGAMMASAAGVLGGAMHIATHAFGKITLFFCAGAIMVASHKSEISQMRGLGHKMPITFICFLIASLSIIGLPPFGGMWSKWYLALGAAKTDQQIFIAVLMISSLLNVAYLLPIVARGFFSKSKGVKHNDSHIENHVVEPQANNLTGDAISPNQWKFSGKRLRGQRGAGGLAMCIWSRSNVRANTAAQYCSKKLFGSPYHSGG